MKLNLPKEVLVAKGKIENEPLTKKRMNNVVEKKENKKKQKRMKTQKQGEEWVEAWEEEWEQGSGSDVFYPVIRKQEQNKEDVSQADVKYLEYVNKLKENEEQEDESSSENDIELEENSDQGDESSLENDIELEENSDQEDESSLEIDRELEESEIKEVEKKKKMKHSIVSMNKKTSEEIQEEDEDLLENPFSNIEEIKPFNLPIDSESDTDDGAFQKKMAQKKIQEMNKMYLKAAKEKTKHNIMEDEMEKKGVQWIEENFLNDVPRKKLHF